MLPLECSEKSLFEMPKKKLAGNAFDMNHVFTTARILAVFFGLSSFLGFLWFYGQLSHETVYLGLVAGGSMLAAASLPRKFLKSKGTRTLGIVLCLLGIVAQWMLVQDYPGMFTQEEIDLVVILFIPIFALAVMAIEFTLLLKHFAQPREPGF